MNWNRIRQEDIQVHPNRFMVDITGGYKVTNSYGDSSRNWEQEGRFCPGLVFEGQTLQV